MLRSLKNFTARQALNVAAMLVPQGKTRAYEGAGGGRRWSDNAGSQSAIGDTLAARGPLAKRARHFTQNSPVAAKAAEEIPSAIVGAGFSYQSLHPDESLREQIESAFRLWSRRADFDARTNLNGVLTQASRNWCVVGEAFIRFRMLGNRLALQMIDPEQIDPALTRDIGGGARIIAGIEFDSDGRRIAYHVLTDPPGQPFANVREPVRVPASEILHLYTPLWPGQVRGVSWFAPSLLKLKEFDELSDALTTKANIAARFAVFITDGLGEEFSAASSLNPEKEKKPIYMETGSIMELASGEDVRFPDLPRTGQEMIDLLRWQAREIAAGIGITYEMLTGDLSGVNYSSIRAGTIDFRRRIDALRKHTMEPQVLEPIWQRWLATEALSGRVSANAILRDFEAASAVEIIPPGWTWIDPQKEIAADRDAVDAGFKSRREVVATRGRDIDSLDAEIANDRERQDKFNLNFGGAVSAETPPAAGSPSSRSAGGGAAQDQEADG